MVSCAVAVTDAATEHTATRLLHLLHPDPTAMWYHALSTCSFSTNVRHHAHMLTAMVVSPKNFTLDRDMASWQRSCSCSQCLCTEGSGYGCWQGVTGGRLRNHCCTNRVCANWQRAAQQEHLDLRPRITADTWHRWRAMTLPAAGRRQRAAAAWNAALPAPRSCPVGPLLVCVGVPTSAAAWSVGPAKSCRPARP